ncbi:MAG: hypothetical protein ACLTHI_03350 [Bacteroides uniformis]
MRVVFAPEVEEDLYGLIKILVEKEYLGTYPFAISYVEELIADIQQNIHSKLKKESARFFLSVMVRICITSLINVILIRRGIFSSLSLEILILLNT